MTVLILYVFDQFQALYFREVMYLEWLVDSHRMCWFHIDVVRMGALGTKVDCGSFPVTMPLFCQHVTAFMQGLISPLLE